jgi:hypothetical protein
LPFSPRNIFSTLSFYFWPFFLDALGVSEREKAESRSDVNNWPGKQRHASTAGPTLPTVGLNDGINRLEGLRAHGEKPHTNNNKGRRKENKKNNPIKIK